MSDVFAGWTERYALEPKGIQAGWRAILGPDALFPRDVVYPIPGSKKKYQKSARNLQEYYRLVEEQAPRADLWVGWSPSEHYDLEGMDRVFGDVDSADLEDALVRARRFEEWCMAHFDVRPAAVFTQGKGFHLHLTHDFVSVPGLGKEMGVGTAYSDAMASLVQGSGAGIDLHTLKYRKTYPRVPYTLNLKATGKHRKPMFVVPVDLTWDLDEMFQAGAEIRVTPFKVPHSAGLAELLQPLVDKNLKQHERRQKTSGAVQQGIHDDLVQAAIAFSETVGWKLVDAHGRADGRRRVLSSLYIPALMRQSGGDLDYTLGAVEAFVDLAGGSWREYRRFAEDTAKHCVLKDGSLRSPVGLRRFWMEAPELRVAKTPENRVSK